MSYAVIEFVCKFTYFAVPGKGSEQEIIIIQTVFVGASIFLIKLRDDLLCSSNFFSLHKHFSFHESRVRLGWIEKDCSSRNFRASLPNIAPSSDDPVLFVCLQADRGFAA